MKATLKKLFVLALALMMVIGLVACAPAPEMDLEDAAENLEDEDYLVSYIDDEDDLSPGRVESLSAENDDGDELNVIRFEKSSTAKAFYNYRKVLKSNEKASLKEEIKNLKHLLKNYEDDMKNDEIDDLEDELKDLEKELDKFEEENILGIKGKVVWYGNKSAVEDSKG